MSVYEDYFEEQAQTKDAFVQLVDLTIRY